MKIEIGVRGWSVVVLLLASASPARATSFSAELVDTRPDGTHTVPFAFNDQSYRFELVAGAQTLVVTGNTATGVVRMLVPSEKIYVETGRDEPRSWMTSPYALYAYHARAHEERTEGTESIDGIPCTKRVVFKGEQVYATAWFSAEYGFPLKVEVPILQRTVELRHLKAGPQAPALFAVPADYKPAPPQEENPPPPWAAQIPGAPIVAPPFEQQVPAGKIVRMQPQAGKAVRIRGSNTTKATCAFTGIGFKNGRPLGDPSGSTVNLEPDQEVILTFEKTAAQADDLVIYVREGTVTLKAELIPAPGTTPGPKADANVASDIEAEVTGPAAADMATRIEVTWSGPGAKDDYITLARPSDPPGRYGALARIREGNPVKLWAPSEPGQFELRYVLAQGTKVLAKTPITINAVSATVTVDGPVKASAWIKATWTGPSGDGDLIGVARPKAPAMLERTATKQGNPAQVRAPGEPGEYEVRYVLGRGNKVLATTTVTIEDVTATVAAASAGKTGADVEVTWNGPAYVDDSIVLARPGQPAGASVVSKSVRTGSPLRLRAPTEPGDYEVRYLLGHGKRTLAAVPIKISAAP